MRRGAFCGVRSRKVIAMKRLLAALLCLLAILALLVGCNNDSGKQPQDSTTPADGTTNADGTTSAALDGNFVDVGVYQLIRSENASSSLIASAVQLKKDMDALTGTAIEIHDDWVRSGTPDDEAYEILVGRTNRPQSEQVLASIDGNGYAIRTVGHKIVIVGSNDDITIDAVNFFFENYIKPTAGNGGFRIPEVLEVVNTGYTVIDMISNGKCRFDVVYREGLDATADSKGKVDYVVMQAQRVRQEIINLTGANVKIKTDWVKPGADPTGLYEILIGDTSRPESTQGRESYAANEYGFSLIGNKIVVTGWNEQSVGFAVDAFISFLKNSLTIASDKTKNISFVHTAGQTKEYSRWTVDIPEYEGGKLEGTVTCNNDQLEYYYTGTTEAQYRAYRQKLESAGYKLYCENEINGNLYATYTNSSTMIHAYFVKYSGAVRIITGSLKGRVKLPEHVDKAPAYEKVTESKVTQMMLQYETGNFGMCYIVTLEDGSFIVFDGGGHTSGKTNDYVRLYNLLEKLNERKDGKIVIAAWIITHPHWDHHESFLAMCKTYGKKVTIEQCIANVADSVVYYNSNNPDAFMENDFSTVVSSTQGATNWVKPHTGMKFWVRNAQIEVLYTQEDLYPTALHTFNDSTMVTRMTIGGQVITWLGDVQSAGSNVIVKMYGKSLKSDIVQVSHHGYNGATRDFYTLLKPSILLWPTKNSSYKAQTAGTSTTAHYVVDHYIATGLGVKDIFVADGHNICLPLPYTPGSNKAFYVDVPVG